jgi:hypothetical protein
MGPAGWEGTNVEVPEEDQQDANLRVVGHRSGRVTQGQEGTLE